LSGERRQLIVEAGQVAVLEPPLEQVRPEPERAGKQVASRIQPSSESLKAGEVVDKGGGIAFGDRAARGQARELGGKRIDLGLVAHQAGELRQVLERVAGAVAE